jgi:UDP-N-acetylmuramate dehydrogenase
VIQLSMRRRRFGFVVPRVGTPSARARPAASRGARRRGCCGSTTARTVASTHVQLADVTTLRLGGPARRVVEASTTAELVDTVRTADAAGEPVLIVGGGSNLVVGDEGWPGLVVLVRTRGIERDGATLTVPAGEPWDDLVAHAVDEGLSGLAAMSGVPGLTGATPVQNVGAYGTEVADVIAGLQVLDRETGAVEDWNPVRCAFGFRTSAFKHTDRYVVLSVTFALTESPDAPPVRYLELARRLGVEQGATAPSVEVRKVVLELRASKGMVLDASDRDTWSVGSFFVNPFVAPNAVPDGCPNWVVDDQVGRLADRARRLRQGVHRRLRARLGVDQALACPHQPRRRHDGRAARARPGDPRRRRAALRSPAASRGPSGGRRAMTCGRPCAGRPARAA